MKAIVITYKDAREQTVIDGNIGILLYGKDVFCKDRSYVFLFLTG